MGQIGRCREDAGERRRGPVSLGINLATGSTNRLSLPISCQHTHGYWLCQAAAAAAPRRTKSRFKGSAEDCNSTEVRFNGGRPTRGPWLQPWLALTPVHPHSGPLWGPARGLPQTPASRGIHQFKTFDNNLHPASVQE